LSGVGLGSFHDLESPNKIDLIDYKNGTFHFKKVSLAGTNITAQALKNVISWTGEHSTITSFDLSQVKQNLPAILEQIASTDFKEPIELNLSGSALTGAVPQLRSLLQRVRVKSVNVEDTGLDAATAGEIKNSTK